MRDGHVVLVLNIVDSYGRCGCDTYYSSQVYHDAMSLHYVMARENDARNEPPNMQWKSLRFERLILAKWQVWGRLGSNVIWS